FPVSARRPENACSGASAASTGCARPRPTNSSRCRASARRLPRRSRGGSESRRYRPQLPTVTSPEFTTVEPTERDDGDPGTDQSGQKADRGAKSHAGTDECDEKDEHVQL